MNKKDLLELVANGENSGVEFKQDNIRPEQLAKEFVALANLKGGHSATVPENVPETAKMSLKKDNNAKTVPDNSTKKSLPGLLLSLLKANPHMTYEELAENTGQNRKTVQRHVQTLGLLRRIGGAKGGHWDVIDA